MIRLRSKILIQISLSFWLSLLIHCLLFSFIVYHYFFPEIAPQEKTEDTYYYFVPAYTPSPPVASKTSARVEKVKQDTVTDPRYDLSLTKMNPAYKELMTANEFNPAAQQSPQPAEYRYLEPIRMVGEKLLDDPFRKLLGRAITGKLYYPDIARNLHLRGTVSIGFILHPDGTVTHARIVKSSRARVLDLAALDAITRASPIYNVDLYIKEAQYMVVNIIF